MIISLDLAQAKNRGCEDRMVGDVKGFELTYQEEREDRLHLVSLVRYAKGSEETYRS
jgi:hypothetical protein